MDVIQTELDLADRDLQLNKLEKEITAKKQLLLEKYKNLQQHKKVNLYMEGVKGDYRQYYKKLLEEKQKQEEAMNRLNDYLKQLMGVDSLAKEELENMEKDKEDITKEIGKIKTEILSLINASGKQESESLLLPEPKHDGRENEDNDDSERG